MHEKYQKKSDAWKLGYNAFRGSMRCPYRWDSREWTDYMTGLVQADKDDSLQRTKP